jgi:hypothetical protein
VKHTDRLVAAVGNKQEIAGQVGRIRSIAAQATVAPVPPVLVVPSEVATPPVSTENDEMLLDTPLWLLT